MTNIEKSGIMDKLHEIRQSIDNESVSWAEFAFLQGHHKEIYELGDIVLAEWSGILEEDWNRQEAKDNRQ